MQLLKVLVLASLLPTIAVADDLGPEPSDAGKITRIKKGVFEADVGGIFVISHDRRGADTEGNTRVASTGSLGGQYFVANNVSIGATVLLHYDQVSPQAFSWGFGGLVFASLHVRLGLGAFLRPTLGAGVIKGNLETDVAPGMVVRADQIAGRIRVALPFAYFPHRRIVIQAGPELNITAGNSTPEGGEAESFTTIAGGFGVGAGYTF